MKIDKLFGGADSEELAPRGGKTDRIKTSGSDRVSRSGLDVNHERSGTNDDNSSSDKWIWQDWTVGVPAGNES